MSLQKIAAFSDGAQGGNPAGVWIGDELPAPADMQRIAAEVGFSETAFAAPLGDGRWRVRYFAPESEVPFCGHATIALGAALAQREGDGVFALSLSQAEITVEGRPQGDLVQAALQSPPTRSGPVLATLLADALAPLGIVSGSFVEANGSDISPMLADGVPGVGLSQDGMRYFDYHHTPDDTLDKVDPAQLRQNVAAWTAMLAVLAGPVEEPKRSKRR